MIGKCHKCNKIVNRHNFNDYSHDNCVKCPRCGSDNLRVKESNNRISYKCRICETRWGIPK